MVFIQLFLVCTILGTISAQTFSVGECNPKLQTVDSFQREKIIGEWFVVKRSYDSFEEGSKCTKGTLSLNDNGGFTIGESLTHDDKAFQPPGAAATPLAKIAEKGGNRKKLQYVLNPDDAKLGKFKFSPGLVSDVQSLWFLDTDYDNYAVAYSCTNAHNGKIEFVWVVGKKPELGKKHLEKAENALKERKIALPLIPGVQDCK